MLRDLTDLFFEKAFPTYELLYEQKRRGSSWGNAIVQINGLIIGSQASGKTTMMESMALRALSKYGFGEFNAVRSSFRISPLVYQLESLPVNFLYVDDITNSKPTDEEIKTFFTIRHVVREATSMDWGLVHFVVSAHRFYGIPLPFRTTTDYIIWKDIPTNPFDLSLTLRYIGQEAVSYLLANKEKWLEEPELKSNAIVRFGRKIGILRFSLPEKQIMRVV